MVYWLFQSHCIINTKQSNTDFSACTRSATNIWVNLKHLVRVFTLNLSLCLSLTNCVHFTTTSHNTMYEVVWPPPPFLESVYSALHHNNKYNFNFEVRVSSGDLYSWYTWHMKTSLQNWPDTSEGFSVSPCTGRPRAEGSARTGHSGPHRYVSFGLVYTMMSVMIICTSHESMPICSS